MQDMTSHRDDYEDWSSGK